MKNRLIPCLCAGLLIAGWAVTAPLPASVPLTPGVADDQADQVSLHVLSARAQSILHKTRTTLLEYPLGESSGYMRENLKKLHVYQVTIGDVTSGESASGLEFVMTNQYQRHEISNIYMDPEEIKTLGAYFDYLEKQEVKPGDGKDLHMSHQTSSGIKFHYYSYNGELFFEITFASAHDYTISLDSFDLKYLVEAIKEYP